MYEEFGDSSIIAFHCSIYIYICRWFVNAHYAMRQVGFSFSSTVSKGYVRLGKKKKSENMKPTPRTKKTYVGTWDYHFLLSTSLLHEINPEPRNGLVIYLSLFTVHRMSHYIYSPQS